MVDVAAVEGEVGKSVPYEELRSRAQKVLQTRDFSPEQVDKVLEMADLAEEVYREAGQRVRQGEVELGGHYFGVEHGGPTAWSGRRIVEWVGDQDKGFQSHLAEGGPEQILERVKSQAVKTYIEARALRLLSGDSAIHQQMKPHLDTSEG